MASPRNPFDTGAMGAGYARSRPPLHRLIMDDARRALGRASGQPWRRALDAGCGAGLSTKAIEGMARHRIGIEPAESMLQWTRDVAPGADFVVGRAESLPLDRASVDVITAAGSLNYVGNLALFFPEAARVLAPGGAIVVYDFSVGSRFRDSPLLAEWTAAFVARYPKPVSEARPLSPSILAGMNTGFGIAASREFTIGLTLEPSFYLDYMMTETNVAAAVRRGVSFEEIRSWCEGTLAPVWRGGEPREVLFDGYFACLTPGELQPPR